MTTLKRSCLITTVLILLIGSMTVQALPASAVVYDTAAAGKLRDRFGSLKARENTLLIDYDEIRKQIDDLQKRGDRSFDRRIDDLHKQLDSKYYDLQRVRSDLRDVEIKLI